jgi:hypothetical protein
VGRDNPEHTGLCCLEPWGNSVGGSCSSCSPLILQTAGLLPPPCSCVSCVTCAHTVSTLQAFPSFAWARLVLGSSLNITSMPLCLPASFLGSLELELWLCLGILCVHYLTGLISGPPTCGLLEGGKKTSWRFWANLAV